MTPLSNPLSNNKFSLILLITLSLSLSIFSSYSLVSAAITATSAVALTPTLLNQLAELEEALETIKTNQIVLAAIQLKSLVPGYNILNETLNSQINYSPSSDEDEKVKSDKKPSESSSDTSDTSDNSDEDASGSDSDSDDHFIPNSRTLLINSFNSLIKLLPPAFKGSALAEIAAFQFTGNESIDRFVAEKESQDSRILVQSFNSIQLIKSTLQTSPSTSNTSNNYLTPLKLARIVSKLDTLQDEFEELQELQKLSKSSKSSKKAKALKELPESRNKIFKIVQKLTDLVDEI